MSSFQGVLIRGVPAVLFIEVSSFQGVLIRGVPAVLFIEVSSFRGVLIRGVPAVLFNEVSSFQGVQIRVGISIFPIAYYNMIISSCHLLLPSYHLLLLLPHRFNISCTCPHGSEGLGTCSALQHWSQSSRSSGGSA